MSAIVSAPRTGPLAQGLRPVDLPGGARRDPRPDAPRPSPFDLDDEPAYRRWRDWKLSVQPGSVEELTVDVADPHALSAAEREALLERITRANMAIYRSPVHDEDPALPRALGAQLGLRRLDANWLADEDGISRIAVAHSPPPATLHAGRAAPGQPGQPAQGSPAARAGGSRAAFIPYTDRAIRWHTDGYYHPEQRRIRGMLLHCVRPAHSGGVNGLLDFELAYLRLRDIAPAHVRALMAPDAMTIPARSDEDGIARAAQTGPVFSVDVGDGSLHMRYTARTRSIEWKDDAATRAAVACLEGLLAGDAAGVFHVRLQAGMGIVGHNVLHERSAFSDEAARPRLLYRARFLDRAATATASAEAAWRNG